MCSLSFLFSFPARFTYRRVIRRSMTSCFSTRRLLFSALRCTQVVLFLYLMLSFWSLCWKHFSKIHDFALQLFYPFTLFYNYFQCLHEFLIICFNLDDFQYDRKVSRNAVTEKRDTVSSSSVLHFWWSSMDCPYTSSSSLSASNIASSPSKSSSVLGFWYVRSSKLWVAQRSSIIDDCAAPIMPPSDAYMKLASSLE